MKIIIVGDGKVGYSLAENLAEEDHDVTIIDKNAEALRKASENLDVMCIKGSGASTKVLLGAGVNQADLLIAATTSDEMNMVCCLTGKKLGALHTVARIRDPEYASELVSLQSDLELDMVINPEQAAAIEMAHLLRFPSAIRLERFARGRVDFAECRVAADTPLAGMMLRQIPNRISGSILIGIVIRGDEVIIPHGDMVIRPGDTLHVVGKPSGLWHFFKAIGHESQKIRNVLIVGGGRVAVYLAGLLDELGMKTKLIEIDRARCVELAEALPNTLIIHGDGTDEEFLHSENMSQMDAFVATTGRDEENLLAAMLAKNSGVPKVVAKVTRMNYAGFVKNLDIDSIVSPRAMTTDNILRFVRGLGNARGSAGTSAIQTLHRVPGVPVEVLEFSVSAGASLLDIPLKKLALVPDTLLAAIVRGEEILIPHGNDRVHAGDTIIVIAKNRTIHSLDDLLADGGAQGELQDSFKNLGDCVTR